MREMHHRARGFRITQCCASPVCSICRQFAFLGKSNGCGPWAGPPGPLCGRGPWGRRLLFFLGGGTAFEGKGPQRRPQKLLDSRLEEVAQAVVGG